MARASQRFVRESLLPMSAPSLRELAAKLDLSHATVSAALRGGRGVKTSTRERVLIVARELGYRNNPLASALMSEMRRSRGAIFRGTLALLDPGRPEKHDPVTPALKRHFIRRARELGFVVDDIPLATCQEEAAKLGQILRARGFLGVLAISGEASLSLSSSDCEEFAVLELAHHSAPSRFHLLVIDWVRLLTLGFSRLHDLGARRIGLALDDTLSPVIVRGLLCGGLAVCGGHSAFPAIPPFVGPAASVDFAAWLSREKCDAVLATHPDFFVTTPPPLKGALIAGLASPNSPSASCAPSHRLDLRLPDLGAHAADFLIHRVMRREFGPPKTPLFSSVAASWE